MRIRIPELFCSVIIIHICFGLFGSAFAQIGIWTSEAELESLPTSGLAWEALLAAADEANPVDVTVANQNSNNNIEILAAAIVYARTGTRSYKNKVEDALDRLRGKPGGTTLAWARETGAYVMAADLIGYRKSSFRSWCKKMAQTYVASDGITMLEMFKWRPNNWGAMAFGSLAAIYAYREDDNKLDEIRDHWINMVKGPTPDEVEYGLDLSWHDKENDLRMINPKGARRSGINIDGIIPDDLRRGGPRDEPPVYTGYPWEHLQGLITAARILDRAGKSIWTIDDDAIYRAAYCLQVRFEEEYGGWIAQNNDKWMIPFLDAAYGTTWTNNYSANDTLVWEAGKISGWAYVVLEEIDPRPDEPKNLTAELVSSSEVELNWEDLANNESGFRVDRSADGGNSFTRIATVSKNVTRYLDEDLSGSAQYCYRVYAYNGDGNSGYSNAECVFTPPAAPVLSSAFSPDENSISLFWQDNSPDESGFYLERSSGSDANFEPFMDFPENVTSYTDTSLSASTTYCYRLQAFNEAGESVYSNVKCTITQPVTPEGFQASIDTDSTIALFWSNSAGGEFEIQIERSADTSSTFQTIALVDHTQNTFIDTAIATSMRYCYRLRMANPSGQSSPTAEICLATRPSAPSALMAVSVDTGIMLTWEDSTVDETGFIVERSEDGGESYHQLVQLPADTTHYLDTAISLSSEYCYRIQGYNDSGRSDFSQPACMGTAPAAPEMSHAMLIGEAAIQIEWRDNSPDEAGFAIERSEDNRLTFSLLATVEENIHQYQDTSVTELREYCYRVTAFNASGSSPVSDILCKTTPMHSPDGLSGIGVGTTTVLHWNDNSREEAGFIIERSDDGGGEFFLVGSVAANQQQFSDDRHQPAGEFCYRVRAFRNETLSGYSETTCVTFPARDNFRDFFAIGEENLIGSVASTHSETVSNDNVYQVIHERINRENRRPVSKLIHQWEFEIESGAFLTFYLQAHKNASENENFVFSYSTDNINFIDMITVQETADENQYATFALPNTIRNTIYIQVRDTNPLPERAVNAVNIDHMFIRSESNAILDGKGLTGARSVADAGAIPEAVFLDQNYPNPFNPETIISFGLPEAGNVKLVVYNILGQETHVLVDGHLGAGFHSRRWNGKNAAGNAVHSGIYFYRLEVGSEVRFKKMIMLK